MKSEVKTEVTTVVKMGPAHVLREVENSTQWDKCEKEESIANQR